MLEHGAMSVICAARVETYREIWVNRLKPRGHGAAEGNQAVGSPDTVLAAALKEALGGYIVR